MYILLNPEAGGGRALERWQGIETEVARRVGPFDINTAAGSLVIRACVARAMDRGETEFIAAGGDGTVNAVMSALVERAPRPLLASMRLGAIGLGSSNDFHKPLARERSISGIPVRINFGRTSPGDVCTIDYMDSLNQFSRCEWLINSSLGTAAEANHVFNHPGVVLKGLKRTVPAAAMVFAAVRAVLGFRPQMLEIRVGGESLGVRARNLGIVKRPAFSGSLSYGLHGPARGRLGVYLIGDVGLGRLCLVVWRLLHGRFEGLGTQSWSTTEVSVRAADPFAVERDGEIIWTRAATYRVLPEAIQLCC
jgi:diacylglycerol kinase family enzyme